MAGTTETLVCYNTLHAEAMGHWATKELLEHDNYSAAARWVYELALLAGGPKYAASWFSGTGDEQALHVEFWGLLDSGWLVHSAGQTSPSPSADFADLRMIDLGKVSSWRAHALHFRPDSSVRPNADTRNIWLRLERDDSPPVDIGKDVNTSEEREAFVLAVLAWLAGARG